MLTKFGYVGALSVALLAAGTVQANALPQYVLTTSSPTYTATNAGQDVAVPVYLQLTSGSNYAGLGLQSAAFNVANTPAPVATLSSVDFIFTDPSAATSINLPNPGDVSEFTLDGPYAVMGNPFTYLGTLHFTAGATPGTTVYVLSPMGVPDGDFFFLLDNSDGPFVKALDVSSGTFTIENTTSAVPTPAAMWGGALLMLSTAVARRVRSRGV